MDILGRLFLGDGDGIVNSNYTDQTVFFIDNRQDQQAILLKEPGHFFLVQILRHLDYFPMHDLPHPGLQRCNHQFPKADHTHQFFVACYYINVVGVLGRRRHFPQVGKGSPYGHILRYGHKFGGHQSAGGILLIGQELF